MNPIRIEVPSARDAQADALRRLKVAELRIILATARVHFGRASRNAMIRQAVAGWLSGNLTDAELLNLARNVRILNPLLDAVYA